MTDRSGHYRSSIHEVVCALAVIEKLGVDIDKLLVYVDKGEFETNPPPSGKYILEAYAALQQRT
jgi:hypothetical protein